MPSPSIRFQRAEVQGLQGGKLRPKLLGFGPGGTAALVDGRGEGAGVDRFRAPLAGVHADRRQRDPAGRDLAQEDTRRNGPGAWAGCGIRTWRAWPNPQPMSILHNDFRYDRSTTGDRSEKVLYREIAISRDPRRRRGRP